MGLAEHPLPRLLAAGVACSIGPDDPLLFGCNLLDEFIACRIEMGLSDAELAACARSSFIHSRAPEAVKKQGLEGIAKWLADEDPEDVNVKRQKVTNNSTGSSA